MYLHAYQRGFRKLIAWQEAHKLALELYKRTATFPQEDRFGLVSQMRRASASIGALIAEGSTMGTMAHQKSYYVRAYGSAVELDNHLQFAFDLGRFLEQEYEQYLKRINRVSSLLAGMIRSSSLHQPLRQT